MSKLFESIFSCSPVAMIMVDEDSVIKLVNRYAEDIFCYRSDELVGQPLSMLIPDEFHGHHADLVKQYFRAPLSRKMGVGRDLYAVKKGGDQFPVEVGLNPIESDGQVFVLSSIIDITDRKNEDARFRAAVEAAPNGMLMIDTAGTIVLSNKQAEEIFGYAREELLGKQIEMLVPEQVKSAHPAYVQSYICEPQPRKMGVGRELYGRHKSGREVPVEVGLQPVYYNNTTYVISSILDITERKAHEKIIQEQSDELREFSYRTSHDLKSPLISISGLIDFVIKDIETARLDDAKDGALRVKQLTNKLNTLVSDILALTKISLDQEQREAFNFEVYKEEFSEKFSHLIREKGVSVQSNLGHQADLYVQKTRMTQVLDNLVSNAIKYCDKSRNDRYVKVSTFNDAESFFVQVADNGIGIPDDQHQHVFEMFRRCHSDVDDGSGLGLYMIKKHLEKMAAEVCFESSPEGTTFYLKFNRA